jgi:hypothetical protein
MRGDLMRWLATRGEDEKVLAYARDAARRFLADSSSVDPGITEAVLSLAAKQGDAALFAEYQRRLEATDVPAIRRRYLGALGAFEDPALEAKAIEYAFSDKVRPTELFLIMQPMGTRNEASAARLFKWMMEHYDQIAARLPPPALRFLPMMAGGCSEERLRAATAFFSDPAHSPPGVDKTLERVGDNVHTCISLREREGERVNSYMRGSTIN